MKKLIVLLLGAMLVFGSRLPVHAQSNLTYDVRFPNAAHNEARITLTIHSGNHDSLHIAMSRSSPGRYALHEFAKNVYDVAAVDGQGDTLQTHRADLHNWVVDGRHERIKFSYTLYGDHADGTYDGINRQHAHLNAPATYAWVKEMRNKPLTVQFHPPEDSWWKVATQLKPTAKSFTFTAPNMPYLMDSPVELSNFDRENWEVKDGHARYSMRMAMHHNGTHAQLTQFVKMVRKVVAEEEAVYGEFPRYDYGTYTFIMGYLPYVFRDGMEHRNSTVITGRHPLQSHALQNLYTVAHEFFHCWNIERLRPTGIKPFNFQKANMSRALWFGEGFTNYYDDLAIRRAGLIADSTYAHGWDGVLNYVLNAPGNQFYSAVQMSMQSPFVDAATSIDHQNKSNTYISYYPLGSVIGLALDLTLRSRFEDCTLDDFMRAMWQKYGRTEQAYNVDDLRQMLGKVTGDSTFANHFFDTYITGRQSVDLKPLLANAGFQLRKAHPGKGVIEFRTDKIDFGNSTPVISANTIIGSPLYKAGIDRGDQLLALDGKNVETADDLNRLVSAHQPGDTISVKYRSVGQTYNRKLTLAEDRTLEVVPYEQAGKTFTPSMKRFRHEWLGSKAK